jgi:hypothetical protein
MSKKYKEGGLMLYFIIPLRSRAASRDWSQVSELCRRTLKACSAQTTNNFQILLVCHEVPDILSDIKNLTILRVDFPVPMTRNDQSVDKYRKIRRALVDLRGRAPFFWAKVDADDCVSNRLCEFVTSRRSEYGWYFPTGYVYTEGDTHLYLERTIFHKRCGTSTILRAACADELPTSDDAPLSNFGYLNVHHNEIVDYMRAKGATLEPLPFPGAVYCVGNGENWSQFKGVTQFRSITWTLRRWLNRRKITDRLAQEFSLAKLNAAVV